jgi:hypothetical protein
MGLLVGAAFFNRPARILGFWVSRVLKGGAVQAFAKDSGQEEAHTSTIGLMRWLSLTAIFDSPPIAFHSAFLNSQPFVKLFKWRSNQSLAPSSTTFSSFVLSTSVTLSCAWSLTVLQARRSFKSTVCPETVRCLLGYILLQNKIFERRYRDLVLQFMSKCTRN